MQWRSSISRLAATVTSFQVADHGGGPMEISTYGFDTALGAPSRFFIKRGPERRVTEHLTREGGFALSRDVIWRMALVPRGRCLVRVCDAGENGFAEQAPRELDAVGQAIG